MNTMRPDEIASLSEIEASSRRNKAIGAGVKTAAKAGLVAAGGGIGAGIASKVVPFLSEFITPDIAVKGISKISPKIGDFLKRGMESGLPVKEGLEFIKDKINATKEPPKENRNIIEQYSPELHQIISDGIKKGKSPYQATLEALKDAKFAKIIQKIAADHGTSYSAILESVYGPSNDAPRFTNPFAAPAQNQSSAPLQSEAMQPNQQPGSGQQALMAILQKLNQSRGGR